MGFPFSTFPWLLHCQVSGLAASSEAPAKLVWYHPIPKVEIHDIPSDTYLYYCTAKQAVRHLVRSKKKLVQSIQEPIYWLSVRQKFFSAALVSEQPLVVEQMLWKAGEEKGQEADSGGALDQVGVALALPSKKGETAMSYAFYFGPNDYYLLKGIAPKFEELHYLGPSLVKQINRYLFVPLAYCLHPLLGHFLLVLLLLILLLHLLQIPFSLATYRTQTKKALLGPQVAALRARYGEDQAGAQLAEQQLYQRLGIYSLRSMAPMLLQLPLALTLLFFTRYTIAFRQLPLLWIKDLSSYDQLVLLPFAIPFIGTHISGLALLMTCSMIVPLVWPSQSRKRSPQEQMQTYLMAAIFFPLINSLPAAWHLYQLSSKLVGLGLERVFKLFISQESLQAELQEKVHDQEQTHKKNRAQLRVEKRIKKEE